MIAIVKRGIAMVCNPLHKEGCPIPYGIGRGV